MHEIARGIGKHVPGIICLDLYASDEDVYFAEFTFTTAACTRNVCFQPLVADGLLYAILHGQIDPNAATAKYVEKTIGGKSWAFVSLDK